MTRPANPHTSQALEILDLMIGDDAERRAGIAAARLSHDVAQLLFDARKDAQLSQSDLGVLAETTQSAIARQESEDYRGHTLSTLARLFYAMGLELVITTRPIDSATDAKPAAAPRAKRATAKTSKATERTGKATVDAKKPPADPARKSKTPKPK